MMKSEVEAYDDQTGSVQRDKETANAGVVNSWKHKLNFCSVIMIVSWNQQIPLPQRDTSRNASSSQK